jgi:hypothetical protein
MEGIRSGECSGRLAMRRGRLIQSRPFAFFPGKRRVVQTILCSRASPQRVHNRQITHRATQAYKPQLSRFWASDGQSKPYTPFADPHHPEGPKPDRSYIDEALTTREFRGDISVLESTIPVMSWWGQSKAYTSALDPSMPAQLSTSLDLQRSDRVRAGRGVRIDSLTFVIACPITRKVTLLRHHFPGPSNVGLGYTPG